MLSSDTDRGLVESHLELVEVHPITSFVASQVVVEVPCRETERVELYTKTRLDTLRQCKRDG